MRNVQASRSCPSLVMPQPRQMTCVGRCAGRRHLPGVGVRMLVAFGSRVTAPPPPGPNSDLDIAISLAAPRQRMGLWTYDERLSRLFPGESLDLSFLDGADPLFRWEIMRRSVLLWGDPDAYCE